MAETIKALLDSFEMITPHICAKNMQPFAGLPMTIAPLADELKQVWRVRFAYGTYGSDGRFMPCG